MSQITGALDLEKVTILKRGGLRNAVIGKLTHLRIVNKRETHTVFTLLHGPLREFDKTALNRGSEKI